MQIRCYFFVKYNKYYQKVSYVCFAHQFIYDLYVFQWLLCTVG